MNIGIFQYEMQDESPLEKIDRLAALLNEKPQLDLVVCPELFISGYGSFEKIKEYSENRDGKFANTIASLAKKTCTAIVYGYPEIQGDSLFNSAQLFDSKGISIAIIAKKCCHQPLMNQKYLHLVKDSSILSINGIKLQSLYAMS